jgi:hypothetical protein
MSQRTIHTGLRSHISISPIRVALIFFAGCLLLTAPWQGERTGFFSHSPHGEDKNALAIESESTTVPQSTPEPGLIIRGDVHLNDFKGVGFPDARIYRAFAGYAGELVATTDKTGHYDTGFARIPGDEMVAVWAAKEGYMFEPQQYYWRHYYGREVSVSDFYASPLVASCPPPLPTPNRLSVDRGSWIVGELSTTIYVYLAYNQDTATASTIITVTSESGTVTQTGTLSIWTGLPVTIPLLPETVHHLTVYSQFDYAPECFYITRTGYDYMGWPLTITQELPFKVNLPAILR